MRCESPSVSVNETLQRAGPIRGIIQQYSLFVRPSKKARADAPQSLPLSGTGWQFHDGCGWPFGSAAAAIPAVPELTLAVSSLRSRHWHSPRGYKPLRASMSRTLFSLAKFQVIRIGRFCLMAEVRNPKCKISSSDSMRHHSSRLGRDIEVRSISRIRCIVLHCIKRNYRRSRDLCRNLILSWGKAQTLRATRSNL